MSDEANAPPRAPVVPAGSDSPRPRRLPSRRTTLTVGASAVVVSAGAIVAAVLLTRGGASHRLNVRGNVVVIEQIGQPGAPGSSQVEVAQISGLPGGKGAAVLHATIGPGGAVNGVAHLYFEKGSFTTHYVGRAIPQPTGSFLLVATEKVVDSSGAFAGASGTEKITGVNRIGAPTSTFHAQGTITY
jgi:hypothetical protein